MILLAFRATKHYWHLAVRQLMLPIGMRGESFPYRSDFVYPNLVGCRFPLGLICAKFDVADCVGVKDPVYFPFRFVTQVEPKVVPTGTIRYFDYVLGPTVDYRRVNWAAYSTGITQAVRTAMAKAGDEYRQDSDSNLVIDLEHEYPHLPDGEELDRWSTLTRLLTQSDTYRNLYRSEPIHSQYQRVVYARLASINEAGKAQPIDPQANYAEGRAVLPVGRDCAICMVTNISPDLPAFKPLSYRLEANTNLFSTIDDASEIFQGIANHRFMFHARRLISARTHLRLRATDTDLYAPEIVLPITLVPSTALMWRAFGAFLVFLGVFGAFLGVLPDDSLRCLKDWFSLSNVTIDSFRFAIRFAALTLTTSGLGISLLEKGSA